MFSPTTDQPWTGLFLSPYLELCQEWGVVWCRMELCQEWSVEPASSGLALITQGLTVTEVTDRYTQLNYNSLLANLIALGCKSRDYVSQMSLQLGLVKPPFYKIDVTQLVKSEHSEVEAVLLPLLLFLLAHGCFFWGSSRGGTSIQPLNFVGDKRQRAGHPFCWFRLCSSQQLQWWLPYSPAS